MFDTTNEIIEKIKLGEDNSFELKSVRFKGNKPELSRSDISDEIAAFANSSDGVILFGVDDKTKLVEGIELNKLDIMETFIREIVNDSIVPSPNVKILKIQIPDNAGELKPILKVEIPKSLFVHKSANGYFRRIGSSKREMPPDILARLFQQRSQTLIIRFDEQPVPDTSLNDIEPDLLKRFANLNNQEDETILEKIKILTKDDTGHIRLTVAGVLLCTIQPSKFLPNAVIEAVCYTGNTKDSNYQIDAQILNKNIDTQIFDALHFIKKNMNISATKSPGRIDKPRFDLRACFEAIVNAIAHRDYSIQGSKIRLFIFSDRLEIYSPGAIPNTMTIESLALRQSTRNELISSLLAQIKIPLENHTFSRMTIMDKRGEGVPIIYSESEKLSGKKPEYKLIDDSELLLIIYSS